MLNQRPKLSVSNGEMNALSEQLATNSTLRSRFALDPQGFLSDNGIEVGELKFSPDKLNKPSEACTLAVVCWVFAGVGVVYVAGAAVAVVAVTGTIAATAVSIYVQTSVYTYSYNYDPMDTSYTNLNSFVC